MADSKIAAELLRQKYLLNKGVDSKLAQRLANGEKVKFSNGKENKNGTEVNLTDGISKEELAALGVKQADIDVVIAQGWALDSDSTKQTNEYSTVIEDDELDKTFTAIRQYADAHGISEDEAEKIYFKCSLSREDLQEVKKQRIGAEDALNKDYVSWQNKKANQGKSFSEFLTTKNISQDSVINKNILQNGAGLVRLAFASRFSAEIQKETLGVKTPIKTE